jgi:hypothetical protein
VIVFVLKNPAGDYYAGGEDTVVGDVNHAVMFRVKYVEATRYGDDDSYTHRGGGASLDVTPSLPKWGDWEMLPVRIEIAPPKTQ